MRRRLFVILAIAVVGNPAALRAQAPALPVSSVIAAPATEIEPSAVRLLVGRSTLVDVGTPIARVSLTSADIADALVTSPSQLLVNGKTPGTISLFVWDRAGAIRRYEVIVQRDLSRLAEQLRRLLPGEQVAVQSNGRDIVLSGRVSSKDVSDKAVNLAAGYVDKREEVVSLMQLQAPSASNQVLLRVRFAEVSRNALTELGASLFTGAHGYKDYLGRSTTGQFAAPIFKTQGETSPDDTHLVFSDFLNLFLFDMKNQLGVVIKALQTRGLFQSLAEPNLVAESGKEASFLAGGEFPIPVVQGSGANLAISVQFKEFGVRLSFTPVVEGDRVHLKVRPEVSTLDFANAVVLNGFRIPALTTRRTETELELQDGQTFAIAGLLNNTMTRSLQKIPGIGDIPILGLLFRSEAAQKDRTELVVMITPQILSRSSSGVTADLPRIPEPYLEPLPQKQTIEPPPPAFRDGRGAAVQPVPPSAVPVPPGSAAEAARAVSALTPGATKVIQSDAAGAAKPSESQAPPKAKLSRDEQKALERAKQQEREAAKEAAKLEQRLKAAENKRRAEQAEADRRAAERQAEMDRRNAEQQAEIERRNAEQQRKQAEKLARAQAKRDKEAAKRNAEAVKRAQAAARHQAELSRKQQKVIEEAAARFRAAEAAYRAEVAKTSRSQE